jgi:thiol:disulfide interchange protein DsbD
LLAGQGNHEKSNIKGRDNRMRKFIALLLTSLFFSITFFTQVAFALSQEDILKPDEAFILAEPTLIAPDKIKLTWEIAEEYYLYKDEFNFSSDNVVIGQPTFSESKPKRDVTMGKVVDVFYKKAEITLPISTKDGNLPAEIHLKTRHQGCFEGGICFPPKENTFTLANAEGATETAGLSLAEQLGLKKGQSGAIPVEEAFQLEVLPYNPAEKMLTARVYITPDHYLYKEKFKFTLDGDDQGQLGEPEFPPTVIKNDPYYGEIDVYTENVDIKIPVTGELSDNAMLATEYQGCSESSGICYPPVTAKYPVQTGTDKPVAEAVDNSSAPTGNAETKGDVFVDTLNNKNFITIMAVFFIAGLGLALTPCVFPMIPILSGIIAGQSGYLSTSRAFVLSLAYVLPMALTYAIVGIIAGMSGANLQVILQTPWVIGSFAFLFVILSLSMFGFYELQMPASVQSRLSEISNRQQGGSIIGAGIMGVLSALIVGPCVTAPLISALIFIAQTKDAVLGGMALFALGMGMGAPLLAIGTSAGRFLPRAGVWMDTTKSIFGVLMLGLAIWMLDRIVPPQVTMLLTGMLLLVSSIYTGAIDRITEETTNFDRFWKGLGIVMMIYGVLLILGAALGGKHLTQPLKGTFAGGHAISVQDEKFITITTTSELNNLLAQAKANQQLAVMDFYATWCTSCKEVEHTLQQPEVVASLQGIMKIKADVTSNDELMKQFDVFGPPQLLFFGKNAEEVRSLRHVGVIEPTKFVQIIEKLHQAG